MSRIAFVLCFLANATLLFADGPDITLVYEPPIPVEIGWNVREGINGIYVGIGSGIRTPIGTFRIDASQKIINSNEIPLSDNMTYINKKKKHFIYIRNKDVVNKYEINGDLQFKFLVPTKLTAYENGDFEVILLSDYNTVKRNFQEEIIKENIVNWKQRMNHNRLNDNKLYVQMINMCDSPIYIAMRYVDFEERWVTNGWQRIPAKERGVMSFYTIKPSMYLRAEGEYNFGGNFFFITPELIKNTDSEFVILDEQMDSIVNVNYERKGYTHYDFSYNRNLVFNCDEHSVSKNTSTVATCPNCNINYDEQIQKLRANYEAYIMMEELKDMCPNCGNMNGILPFDKPLMGNEEMYLQLMEMNAEY
jgi:hypothetical protein